MTFYTPQIIDLRRELECRTLSSKGLKSQLIARLTKVLKTEEEKEAEDAANKPDKVVRLTLNTYMIQR